MQEQIEEKLRRICEQLRRTPMPIADVVPMLQQAADEIEKLRSYKNELIEILIIDCIYRQEHEVNARQALLDLIQWEVTIALDPAVSSAARDLIEQGRQQALKEKENGN